MAHNPFVLLLNGPAGSGKDMIANYMATKYRFAHLKMAAPLKHALAALLGTRVEWIEMHKNYPVGQNGQTIRQALIELSEGYTKPLMGDDFFGRGLVQDIVARNATRVVVSDCGFECEAQPVVEAFDDVALLQLRRRGYGFSSDSRNYVYNVPVWRFLHNVGSPDFAYEQADALIREMGYGHMLEGG